MMDSDHIAFAIAKYMDPYANTMFEEIEIGGNGRADMLFVSKAGYITEVEIKVSVADWKADRQKAKWGGQRARWPERIKSFYYAVPAEIADKIPANIVGHAGIISVTKYPDSPWPYCEIVRPCVVNKVAVKINPASMARMFKAYHHRFTDKRLKGWVEKYGK